MNGGDRHVARKWTRALTVLGSVAAVLAGLLVWVNAAVLDDSGRPRPAAGGRNHAGTGRSAFREGRTGLGEDRRGRQQW